MALEKEGYGGTVEPGHAAVRCTGPATGQDGLPTIRVEFHRVARNTETAPARETGSSVCTVFDGSGTVPVGDRSWSVSRGDLFVVPSRPPFSAKSEAGATATDPGALDRFRFSDALVFEALKLSRSAAETTRWARTANIQSNPIIPNGSVCYRPGHPDDLAAVRRYRRFLAALTAP